MTKVKNLKNRINDEIESSRIRVVSSSVYSVEEPVLMSRKEAFFLKDKIGTDIIEIAYNEKDRCSICKLIDFNKFNYEEKKKEKERSQNQKKSELKEIKLGVEIAENDFNTKLAQARKFLERGDNVKVSLQLKGRNKYTEFGHKKSEETVLKFAEELSDKSKMVSKPVWNNNRIILLLNHI